MQLTTLEDLETAQKGCLTCKGSGWVRKGDSDSTATCEVCICLLRIQVYQIVGQKVYSAGLSTEEPPRLSPNKSYILRGSDWAKDVCPRIKNAAILLRLTGHQPIPFTYITDLDIKRSAFRGKEDIDQAYAPPNIDSLMRRSGLLILRLGFCAAAPATLADHVCDAISIRGDLPMWVVDSKVKKTSPLLEERLNELQEIKFGGSDAK